VRKIPTCKYCGKTPMKWKQINNRWFLHEKTGEVHDCPKNPLGIQLLKEIMKAKQQVPSQLLPIPSWDEQFMHDVYWWSRRSKDPRTKIGAVLVRWEDKIPISMAYNSFSRKVNDNVPERWERPEKYEWVTHAEDNAVLNCARRGYSSNGCVMYTQGIPCTRCADACVQGGIVEVVVHKQWQEHEQKFAWDKWIDSAKRSQKKFAESGIKIRIFDGVLGMQGVLDGKVIDI
jgi:dCMP deaminase